MLRAMSVRKLLAAVTAQLATGIGLVVAVLSWGDADPGVKLGLTLAAVALTAAGVIVELSNFAATRVRGYRTPARINRFMHGWIAQPGRVAIFSNDMSWVSSDVHDRWYERVVRPLTRTEPDRIMDLLEQKAARKELTLVLPKRTDLSRSLEAKGAQTVTYGELGIIPGSRFTIVRHGHQDAEVAIGRSVNGVHRIEKFANGSHPAFALAADLVKFAESFDKQRQS
jgi:hypothetical protein